jgi:rSAM/selenodomain-associated transferase 2
MPWSRYSRVESVDDRFGSPERNLSGAQPVQSDTRIRTATGPEERHGESSRLCAVFMTGFTVSLSVVIPTLDEAAVLGGLLLDLDGMSVAREVIVVDGGSEDATRNVARDHGATVLSSSRGRGAQLAAGAAAARAPLLLFLHADVRLGAKAIALLDELAVAPPACALAFRLRIDAEGFAYRFIEFGAHLRGRLARLPYGDQGLLVRRADYERAGGYPALPLMEDVALVRALGKFTHVRLMDAAVTVSARRWQRDGPLRRMLANWALMGRYLAGATPEELAAHYRPESQQDDQGVAR